jgi:hypothetical protein
VSIVSFVIFVVAVVTAVFFAAHQFLRIISVAADDLNTLFLQDEDKLWPENELSTAIGTPEFITRVALKLLDEKVGLQRVLVLFEDISGYTSVVLYLQLYKGEGPRKKRDEVVRVKRTLPRLIPVYSAQLDSLRP